MISKTAGGGWKGDVLSRADESQRPCLLSGAAAAAAARLSCLFSVKSVASLFLIETARCKELISLVPYFGLLLMLAGIISLVD